MSNGQKNNWCPIFIQDGGDSAILLYCNPNIGTLVPNLYYCYYIVNDITADGVFLQVLS